MKEVSENSAKPDVPDSGGTGTAYLIIIELSSESHNIMNILYFRSMSNEPFRILHYRVLQPEQAVPEDGNIVTERTETKWSKGN